MNALERLLQDDLDRLLDRLAAAAPEGLLAECADRHPEMLSRIEAAEGRLSAARNELVQGYAAWREALDLCADVWAVAALVTDEPAEARRRAA
jgi:hypothetical protein